MVNNYYKAGPATPGSLTTSSTSNKRNRIFNYTSFYYNGTDTVWGGKFYMAGNFVAGYPDVTADNWTKGMQKDSYASATTLLTAARQTNPFNYPSIRTQTAEEAYSSVLDSAGAILPCRDTIDRRIVRETRTGIATFEGVTYGAIGGTGISHPSGIIDSPTDVGGTPVYNSTAAPLDTDKDGMPDAYEVSKGLNPANAADRNNIGANGYTQLEIYLNSITSPCAMRTATKEIDPSLNFSIYPNPATDQLTILHTDQSKETIISVYDMQGKKLLSKTTQGKAQTSLDISALVKGIYIVECLNGDKQGSLKFVKE